MCIYPCCVYSITVMPDRHLLQGILPPRGGRAQSLAASSQAHTPPPAFPSCHRNINPLSLAHWCITQILNYTQICLKMESEKRRAHLKIQNQRTKGLKICLQLMRSAGFSVLKDTTRQSGQAKQAFFAVFTACIHTLSNDLKIEFMGTKGTTQELRCHCKHIFSAGPK